MLGLLFAEKCFVNACGIGCQKLNHTKEVSCSHVAQNADGKKCGGHESSTFSTRAQ